MTFAGIVVATSNKYINIFITIKIIDWFYILVASLLPPPIDRAALFKKLV